MSENIDTSTENDAMSKTYHNSFSRFDADSTATTEVSIPTEQNWDFIQNETFSREGE